MPECNSRNFNCSLTMAPEEGRNVRNKLVTFTLTETFMIKFQFCLIQTNEENFFPNFILFNLWIVGALVHE